MTKRINMWMDVIGACDLKGSIGKKGKIPWHIREDFQHFARITTHTKDLNKMNAVIMGRKTWESLNCIPLKERVNIIVSRTLQHGAEHELPKRTYIVRSLADALDVLDRSFKYVETVFVIGGGSLYKEAILHERCRNIYLTIVHTMEPGCDAYFPLKLLTDICKEDPDAYSGVLHSMSSPHTYSFHVYHKEWVKLGPDGNRDAK
jgi:dihydrofolate reductase